MAAALSGAAALFWDIGYELAVLASVLWGPDLLPRRTSLTEPLGPQTLFSALLVWRVRWVIILLSLSGQVVTQEVGQRSLFATH